MSGTISSIDPTIISQAAETSMRLPGKLRLSAIVKEIKKQNASLSQKDDYIIEKKLAEQLVNINNLLTKTVLTKAFQNWSGLKDASYATRMAVSIASEQLNPKKYGLPRFVTKFIERVKTIGIALSGGSEKKLAKLNEAEKDICDSLETWYTSAEGKERGDRKGAVASLYEKIDTLSNQTGTKKIKNELLKLRKYIGEVLTKQPIGWIDLIKNSAHLSYRQYNLSEKMTALIPEAEELLELIEEKIQQDEAESTETERSVLRNIQTNLKSWIKSGGSSDTPNFDSISKDLNECRKQS